MKTIELTIEVNMEVHLNLHVVLFESDIWGKQTNASFV